MRKFLEAGTEVRIVTVRVAGHDPHTLDPRIREAKAAIYAWTREHIGVALQATASKDFNMVTLYDDRAVQVETNTGRIIGDGNPE